MILGYLIFAHLLGDFIFQPAKLVMWKMRSVLGTLVHVLIHFGVNLLILLPFLINGYIWLIYVILGICVVHFFVDLAKINYDLRHDQKVRPFIVDQLLHLLTILVANFFLRDVIFAVPDNLFYHIYTNINLIVFLSFLVVISTVIEVYNFQKQREKNKNAQLKVNSNQMLGRIVVFTIIYSFFMFLTFYISSI